MWELVGFSGQGLQTAAHAIIRELQDVLITKS
jgi:Pyruvate/2-oxoacid:ferredoxin oxidoreductase gamma subunit